MSDRDFMGIADEPFADKSSAESISEERSKAEIVSEERSKAENNSEDGNKVENLSVEEGFEMLREILGRMDSEDISLEESFACYEKGVRLVRHISSSIDRVEKKVLELRGNGELHEF